MVQLKWEYLHTLAVLQRATLLACTVVRPAAGTLDFTQVLEGNPRKADELFTCTPSPAICMLLTRLSTILWVVRNGVPSGCFLPAELLLIPFEVLGDGIKFLVQILTAKTGSLLTHLR